jgi:hypothetical protein
MIEISSLTALIIAEVLVGLVILSGLLLILTLLRKGRIRQAATHLAEKVQAEKAMRAERLKALLADAYHLQSPVLDQTVHNIVQYEMTLYQNMLNGFLRDDQIYLQQIDVDVENLVIGYQSLGVFVDESGGSAEGDGEEFDKLKAENERLSDELKVTMDTMGRMLNEYSTMFSDGADDDFKEVVNKTKQDQSSESVEEKRQTEDQSETEMPASVEDEVAAQDDTLIPDLTEQELTESSLTESEEVSGDEIDDLLSSVEGYSADPSSSDEESSADVEDEVSEIIDEVMEIADDMIHESEPEEEPKEDLSESSPESTTEAEPVSESIVDDLDHVDIDIPDVDATDVESTDFEPGSLEEEWAKLLEEESSPDGEKKDT